MLMVIKFGIIMIKDRENNLPAIICANGDKFWYHNGRQRRKND